MYREQLSWPERGRLWLRIGIRLWITVLVVLFVWTLGRPLLSLFMPFLLALGAAALLNPVVRTLQKRLGWSRGVLSLLSLLVVFGAAGTALSLLVRAAVQEMISLAENWQSILNTVEQSVLELDLFLQGVVEKLPIAITAPDQTVLERVAVWLQDWMQTAAPDLGYLTQFATDKAKDVAGFALATIVFLMASYFLCADYPYLRTRIIQRMDDGLLRLVRQIKTAALAAFGGYLKAQLLLTVGVFFILLGGFLLTGQSYALLLALALAVLDFIPIVGSGTIMVPWAVIDLFTARYDRAIAIMLIWGVVVVFRRVAEPKFVGNQTGLSSILSLVSIYVGMRVGGVAGMVLGPILTLVVLNLLGLGLLDGVKADLRLAAEDTAAILRGSTNEK
ncbi:MAG: sporulation integral membrane protein YtvI [Oscillospiraceae bacterium]|nr:sporulation integral membrane protein YtvI [Oscillospiraceae bacterium]